MLLNISNHPCTKWPEIQRRAAIEQYREIKDMPFPQIPPDMDTVGIRQMVEDYEARIHKVAADNNNLIVHLMGELTFTHLLVNRLQKAGIPCVASTSERIVIEEASGKKISQFNFVRFRNYAEN